MPSRQSRLPGGPLPLARSMASKYAKAFTVPPGFPDLLRDLTRELLREYPREHEPQPKDQEYWLLDRAARYFGSRKAMAGAAAHGPNMHDLEARITTIFREADKDNNGVLDHKEFKTLDQSLKMAHGPMPSVRLAKKLAKTGGV